MEDNTLRETPLVWGTPNISPPVPPRVQVVRYCMDLPRTSRKAGALTSGEMITAMKAGLAVSELEDLQKGLDLPMDKLVPLLGISKATWHRRKLAGRLDQGESDRVVRFARLLGRAVEVLESLENARAWLRSPQISLGGAVPLSYAETELGAREVEDLLGRIDYGVYS